MLTSSQDTGRYRAVPTTVLTADPAAGAELSFAVPAGELYELYVVFIQLVTSATVATRQVELVIDDGTNVIYRCAAGATQAASLTTRYNFGANLPKDSAVVAGDLNVPLPQPLVLSGGYRIQTVTTAKDAGDNYGPATLHVIRYS